MGWLNTYQGLIVPRATSAFGIFLLRQFFITIPAELDEAARVDGARAGTSTARIILPLARPALASLAVFYFMNNWNDFLWPLVMTSDTDMRNLPAGLTLFAGQYRGRARRADGWSRDQPAAAGSGLRPGAAVFRQRHSDNGNQMSDLLLRYERADVLRPSASRTRRSAGIRGAATACSTSTNSPATAPVARGPRPRGRDGRNGMRYGFPWYRINPAPGVFDWSWTDQVVDYAAHARPDGDPRPRALRHPHVALRFIHRRALCRGPCGVCRRGGGALSRRHRRLHPGQRAAGHRLLLRHARGVAAVSERR